MQKQSLGRRSSTNPVRISTLEREDRSLTRTDPRSRQMIKPKLTVTGPENSHIPRSRIRSSSTDRGSSRKSTLKTTGKTPLRQHGPTTPITPAGSSKKTIGVGIRDCSRSPSADRASSVGTKGPRKDTRPLSDRTYQSEMLTKIDTFFASMELSHMLNSNGSLKPITLKMFVEVSGLLVKHLSIKQILTITNYVEEIPKIAKKLHYPGIINKSWLKTANAMHSWPNVLGWLSWLVEVCEISEIAFRTNELKNVQFVGTDEQADYNRNWFTSIIDSYNAWNDEKLDEEASLIDKYLCGIEIKCGVTEEELEKARLDVEREMETLQMETGKEIDSEVKELRKVLLALEQDELKQEKDIKANVEFIQSLHVDIDQINRESTNLKEQIERHNKEHDKLVAAVKVQLMSKEEKDSILKECMKIETYMHQFAEHLEDIKKETYTLDLKLASANNNLNKLVFTYNKNILMDLGSDIDVDWQQLKMPEEGATHPDIMEILNTKASLMNDLKTHLAKQLADRESSFEADTNEIESLQERLKMLQDDNKDVVNKLKETKDRISKMKKGMKEDEAKLREQIKILENKIKEIVDSMPNSQALMNEMEELADKLAAVRRRREFIEQSAKKFFDKLYEIIGDHRTQLADLLSTPRHSPTE